METLRFFVNFKIEFQYTSWNW